jgi:hypothetical protein
MALPGLGGDVGATSVEVGLAPFRGSTVANVVTELLQLALQLGADQAHPAVVQTKALLAEPSPAEAQETSTRS